MNASLFEIAWFLAQKALRMARATYQQVGEAVGWSHRRVAALDGRQPEAIRLDDLLDGIPVEWDEQRRLQTAGSCR